VIRLQKLKKNQYSLSSTNNPWPNKISIAPTIIEINMKTAVICFSALGDIAYTLPFLRALAPRPVIITTAIGYELLKDEFNEFLILKSKRPADTVALITQIRHHRLDVLMDLQNNDRSRMIQLLGGAKKNFSNRRMPRGESLYEDRLRILKPTGLLNPLDTTFEPKPRDYIVLNTGSSEKWASKRIPHDKWQQFAKILTERYELPFLLTGSAEEKNYVESIARALPFQTENLTGKTSIHELKQILNGALLTVSTDSGSMHISAAMKTPTLGLFGATNWQRFAPAGPWATALHDPIFYPEGTPPVPNRIEPGPYYDHIDLTEGLNQLSTFLP